MHQGIKAGLEASLQVCRRGTSSDGLNVVGGWLGSAATLFSQPSVSEKILRFCRNSIQTCNWSHPFMWTELVLSFPPSLSLSPSFPPLTGLKLEKRHIWGFPNVSRRKEMFSSMKGDGGKLSVWLTCQWHFSGSCFSTPHSVKVLPPASRVLVYIPGSGPTIPWTLMLHSLLNLLPKTLFLV